MSEPDKRDAADKIVDAIRKAGTVLGLMFVFVTIWTVPVFLLWNWLCPKIFGLPAVTLFESFGVALLAGLLFGKGK